MSKDRYRLSIGFSLKDERQNQAASILKQMKGGKASFIADAIAYYIENNPGESLAELAKHDPDLSAKIINNMLQDTGGDRSVKIEEIESESKVEKPKSKSKNSKNNSTKAKQNKASSKPKKKDSKESNKKSEESQLPKIKDDISVDSVNRVSSVKDNDLNAGSKKEDKEEVKKVTKNEVEEVSSNNPYDEIEDDIESIEDSLSILFDL